MSAIHTINGQEIVAYDDMFEYVEDADFTAYVDTTIPFEGKHIIRPVKPVNDPDFRTLSRDMIELNDGELYRKVWFGEEFDERDRYVKEFNLGDDVFLIYVWDEGRLIYVAFDGIVCASEDDAQAKIKEIESCNDVTWEAVDDGHHTTIQSKGAAVDVLLRVGHGLSTHGDVIGCAELTITKPNNPTITQRLNFSAHTDCRGEVTGEFYNTDGITEDCGDTWDVDTVKMYDPSEMDTGDDRNDDIMKQFIEKYVSRLDYTDELEAARADNFCLDEE